MSAPYTNSSSEDTTSAEYSIKKRPNTLTKSEADEVRREHVPDVDDQHSDYHRRLLADHEYYTAYPNRWSHIRRYIREPAGEFFGTMILIIFGTAVDCQVVLSTNPGVAPSAKGEYLSINFGWACGTALGVWFASGVSGGHINPAVTLALAVFRRFPWRKVPIFWMSQLLGALCGAAIVYANYFHAIDIFEGGPGIRTVPGTASLFSTYALDYMTPVSAFFDEFIGTAVLMLVVLAITDKKNGPPPVGLVPLVLFITILGIGAALGMQTGYAINPARDLGPRLLTAMVGYGRAVFNFRHQYWLWCPVLAPFAGALVGAFIYDTLIFTGDESIVNRPNKAARAHHEHAAREARDKIPSGVDNVV